LGANGWDQLPKCLVAPRLGRHRANARDLKAIDMGMQRAQDCCRDCAPIKAVQYARTTVYLDAEAYPSGWSGDVKFGANDGAALYFNGVRVHDDNLCSSSSKPKQQVPVSASLSPRP